MFRSHLSQEPEDRKRQFEELTEFAGEQDSWAFERGGMLPGSADWYLGGLLTSLGGKSYSHGRAPNTLCWSGFGMSSALCSPSLSTDRPLTALLLDRGSRESSPYQTPRRRLRLAFATSATLAIFHAKVSFYLLVFFLHAIRVAPVLLAPQWRDPTSSVLASAVAQGLERALVVLTCV